MPIEIFSSLSLYFEVLTLQIQCIRNWSGLSGGTSRIIRECSSGDTVAKPAITMALLATGAPDSVNFRAMGYVKFPPHFRQGGSTE